MKDAECAESKEKSFRFFQFSFFELWWKCIENLSFFSTKMTITGKMKIGKIWKLNYLSFQHIPHLSWKFDHFWKKKISMKISRQLKKNWVRDFALYRGCVPGPPCFGIEELACESGLQKSLQSFTCMGGGGEDGESWIKRKFIFQIFPIFIFRLMIFVQKMVNFRWIFTITRKIKIRKMIFLSIQHIPHLSWNFHHFWRRGEGSAYPSLGHGRLLWLLEETWLSLLR